MSAQARWSNPCSGCLGSLWTGADGRHRAAKAASGINSPSTLMRDDVGQMMGLSAKIFATVHSRSWLTQAPLWV